MSDHPILVVEDDSGIRESLLELLADEGFPSVGAKDGIDALKLLRDGLMPCWILLDLFMPNMGGEECLDEIRKDPRFAEVPVTLLSAGASAATLAKHKAVAFLKKPIDIAELFGAAEEFCARTQS